MLLAYVDESFDQDYYWIAALVVTEDALIPLARALDAVVAKAATSYPGVREDSELHGHALMQARDDWSCMKTPGMNLVRARIGIYADALRAIAGENVAIFIRGIDLAAQRARYPVIHPPHSVALRQVLERVDAYAARQGELMLVIADEVAQADGHRQDFVLYQQQGTGGYRSAKLEQIVDTIHFAPSNASRLLQGVDLVAYMYQRTRSKRQQDDRARRAAATLWAQVSPRVIESTCWVPKMHEGPA